MSGFFGIFNRNGNKVDKKIAEDMLESMSSWDPDERDVWINGAVAFGHTMLWNTPESKYEHMPLKKEATILTMDARIDNREELDKELDLPDRSLEKIGDSEFILAAYQKWGEECPKYLLGDFAFAIWDERKQKLFCARDHLGIKQIFYYVSEDKFMFSNDISCLLANENIPKTLNKNTIATFLSDVGIHTKDSTFFEKIYKLPPASILVVKSSEVVHKEFWTIESIEKIKFESFSDYVDKLRILLNDAVEVRLRSSYSISSHLSGGIDSSSIAVLAARKLKKIGKRLLVFNWVDIPENLDKYETESWSYSRKIASNEMNIDHHEFCIDSIFVAKSMVSHNVLTKGNMEYWEEHYVHEELKKNNVRTLLSGWGGDEFITFNGRTYIADLFSKGKFFTVLKYMLEEKKYSNHTWKQFIGRFLRNVFPYGFNIFTKKNKTISTKRTNIFIHEKFQHFVDNNKSQIFKNVIGVRNRQKTLFEYGHLQNRIESWGLLSHSSRIEYRYPLLDKRIVEFAMAIPEKLFFPIEGKERPLFKSVVSDLLPDDILWTNKYDETKINKSIEQLYLKSMKDVSSIFDRQIDCSEQENEFINCKKVKQALKNETFLKYHFEESEYWSILCSLRLLCTMKKFRNNDFS